MCLCKICIALFATGGVDESVGEEKEQKRRIFSEGCVAILPLVCSRPKNLPVIELKPT